jgi:hypothetical protein
MSKFPNGIRAIIYPNGTFELLEEIHYVTKEGRVIVVPIGFHTDFATVPWWAKPWLPAIGKYMYAAAIHDYLLWLGFKWHEAAKIFKEACVDSDVGWRTRTIMYRAIRLFGIVKRKNGA